MLKIKTQKTIDCSDWDALVMETYNRPYCLQQQDDCMPRGTTVDIRVPDDFSIDYGDDSVPEVVNHPDMGVSFKAWLDRDPDQKLNSSDDDWSLKLWWNRNFYPDISMIGNDLYKRGLLPEGEYTIKIDW